MSTNIEEEQNRTYHHILFNYINSINECLYDLYRIWLVL